MSDADYANFIVITSRLLLMFLDFLFEIKVLGYNCGISVTTVTIKFGFMSAFSVKGLAKIFVDMIKSLHDKKMLFNSINLPPIKTKFCQKFSFNL